MDCEFLKISILSTIEMFFSSTAGILFAYSFFRTHKSAQKDYEDSKRERVFLGNSVNVYTDGGKYFVADTVNHNNREEISEADYLSYEEYKNFDFGQKKTSLKVIKDRILAMVAVLFVFAGSFISINRIIESIKYSVIIDIIYLIIGLTIVLVINILLDKINVKEPLIPESIKEYDKKHNHIEI